MDQSRQAIRDLHTARSEPLFKFVVPEANSLKAKSNETRSRSFDALNIGLGWNSGFWPSQRPRPLQSTYRQWSCPITLMRRFLSPPCPNPRKTVVLQIQIRLTPQGTRLEQRQRVERVTPLQGREEVVVRRFVLAFILLIIGSAPALADVRIVSSLG
jgi:hypothetical protein